jgi:hypothetical protein
LKGYDVVLGKLAATSVAGFYAYPPQVHPVPAQNQDALARDLRTQSSKALNGLFQRAFKGFHPIYGLTEPTNVAVLLSTR